MQIERLNKVIKELVREKDEEKERMNEVIEGLAAENETMRNRMENFESMLKVMAQGGQPSSYGQKQFILNVSSFYFGLFNVVLNI